jgi:hypothetical protein
MVTIWPPALPVYNSEFRPQCIYGFCMSLRINRDYISFQSIKTIELRNGVVCFLRGRNESLNIILHYLQGVH